MTTTPKELRDLLLWIFEPRNGWRDEEDFQKAMTAVWVCRRCGSFGKEETCICGGTMALAAELIK